MPNFAAPCPLPPARRLVRTNSRRQRAASVNEATRRGQHCRTTEPLSRHGCAAIAATRVHSRTPAVCRPGLLL
eukprot:7381170-Prymnesium_polylepis.2